MPDAAAHAARPAVGGSSAAEATDGATDGADRAGAVVAARPARGAR